MFGQQNSKIAIKMKFNTICIKFCHK